ncbi:MAG: hypothetical protein AWU56_2462 [Idiomarina sp. T82-3]|nr:MAG: hypothetical protein AWU56_2462 [Idiomarina sp. T82-3]
MGRKSHTRTLYCSMNGFPVGENILSRKMRDLRMAHPTGVEPMTFASGGQIGQSLTIDFSLFINVLNSIFKHFSTLILSVS